MKSMILFLEGMSGAPIEELQGRTPLEVAKTPNLDRLAQKSRQGLASFIPPSMAPSDGIACLAGLGFDPQEFYTGVAPLEAAAMGIRQSDSDIFFRCDLVTVSESDLIDTSAGRISAREASLLIDELNRALATGSVRIYPCGGWKNILVVTDAGLAEKLDETECHAPDRILGKPFAKHLPSGEGADFIRGLMEKSRPILDAHEINRVRIDLGENPANMIWLWGQGRPPKLPAFKQRYGLEGSMVSDCDFAKGLGALLGFKRAKSLSEAAAQSELVFYYGERPEPTPGEELKTQIRHIEEFDAKVVSEAVRFFERFPGSRICVTTDAGPIREKDGARELQAPFMVTGPGDPVAGSAGFGEKAAAQSGFVLRDGHKLMEMLVENK